MHLWQEKFCLEIDLTQPLHSGLAASKQHVHLAFGTQIWAATAETIGIAICHDGALHVKNPQSGIVIPKGKRLCWRCFNKISRLISEEATEEESEQVAYLQQAAIASMMVASESPIELGTVTDKIKQLLGQVQNEDIGIIGVVEGLRQILSVLEPDSKIRALPKARNTRARPANGG